MILHKVNTEKELRAVSLKSRMDQKETYETKLILNTFISLGWLRKGEKEPHMDSISQNLSYNTMQDLVYHD